MEKSVTIFNKRLIKISLILIALSILISTVAMARIVKAQGPAISLSPTAGVAGKTVNVRTAGFGDRTLIIVSLGATEVLRANATYDGQIATSFKVPTSLRFGVYTVNAVEKKYDRIAKAWISTGLSATTTFNILPSGSSSGGTTPTPTTPSDTTPTPIIPSTPSGTTTGGGGDLGPLTIGIVAVAVVAIAVPAAAFYLRSRGGKSRYDEQRPETPYDSPMLPPASSRYPSTTSRAPSSYQSQQSTRPSVTSPYRQQSSYSSPTSRSFSSSRYGSSSSFSRPTSSFSRPTSSFSRPTSGTKMCSSCHKAVRSDYSVCPYCHKVLR